MVCWTAQFVGHGVFEVRLAPILVLSIFFLGMIVRPLHNKFKEFGNQASFTLAEVANKLRNYV